VTHHTDRMWDSDQIKDCHLHKADLGSLGLHSCEQKAFHLTLERNLRHMMFKTTKICMKGTKEILRETKKEKNNNILCIYYTTKSVQSLNSFNVYVRSLFCSPRLHLLIKNNTICVLFEYILKCNLFL